MQRGTHHTPEARAVLSKAMKSRWAGIPVGDRSKIMRERRLKGLNEKA